MMKTNRIGNKKRFIGLISILAASLFIFAATGCGQLETNQPNGNQDSLTGGDKPAGKATLETALNITQAEDGTAAFELKLKNEGDQDIKLEFPSSQMFEITVEDQEGKEVYRYSANKLFAQAITVVEVKAGEEHVWSEELDLAAQGASVEGEVVVKAEILAASELNGLQLDKDNLSASASAELVAQADNGNEQVYENEAFRNVRVEGEKGVYTVKGQARVFEANVSYAVTEGHIYYLEDQYVTATSLDWGDFTIEIDISDQELPVNGTIMLELYEESAKDGSRIHELMIPLETIN